MMVRNERHVIATCIGHLLQTLGVERVYAMDNGSTDGTSDILRAIAAGTGRLSLHADPGAFRQAEVLTGLAQRARADGIDWVLPVDADEFLWLPRGQSLAALCGRSDIGGYRFAVRNFLQARPIRCDGPGAMVTMWVSAVPSGEPGDAHREVASGRLPFVRMRYPNKLLLRTTPTLLIGFGHHDAEGTAGALLHVEGPEVLHAPIRARADLQSRAETGRRVAEVTPEPGQNWHLKRVAAMDPRALDLEWRRNSYAPLWPVAPGRLRLDLRLSHIGLRQHGFRRRFRVG